MRRKNYRYCLAVLACALLCLFAGAAVAQESGPWVYRVDEDGFARITAFENAAALSAHVPAQLDGVWVNGIDAQAFEGASALKTLTLPGSVRHIDEDAFAGRSITLRGCHGSEALNFAQKHGMRSENLSSLDFCPDVVDLSDIDRSDYSYVSNGIRLVKAHAERLQMGSLFFLAGDERNDLGEGYQVRTMHDDGEYVIVKMAEAEPGLILKSIRLDGVDFRIDYDNIEVLQEGITDLEPASAYNIGGDGGLKFKWKRPGFSLNARVDVDLTDVFLHMDLMPFHVYDYQADVTMAIQGEATVSKGNKYTNEWGEIKPIKDVPIFRVPLVTVISPIAVQAIFTVFLTVDANGTVTGSVSVETMDTIAYSDESGWSAERKQQPTWDLEIDAAAELGLELMPAFALRGTVIGEFAAIGYNMGVKLSAESAFDEEWIPTATCVDIAGKCSFAREAWLGIKKDLGKFSIDHRWTFTWPAELEYENRWHFEDFKKVDACTKKGHYLSYHTDYDYEMDPVLVPCDTSVNIPLPTLSRPGYRFLGWYHERSGSDDEKITALTTSLTEDKTIYARWEERQPGEREDAYIEPVVHIPTVPVGETEYNVGDKAIWVYAHNMSQVCDDFPHQDYSGAYYEQFIQNAPRYSFGTEGNTSITSRIWSDEFVGMIGTCEGNTSLETVVLPDTMAFWGVANREISVNSGAFRNCTSLVNVTLPSADIGDENGQIHVNGVTIGVNRSIHDADFYNCVSLPSIYIPSNYTKIGDSAFYGCTSLETVENLENTKVTELGSNAFAGCGSLRNVKLPATVASIGSRAFLNCSNLTSINIPAGCTIQCYDGNSVFDGASLETATIESGIRNIDYVFQNAEKVANITVPASVESMYKAFDNVRGEMSATLQNEAVSQYAFNNCTGLTDVTFEGANVLIDEHAFANCTALATVSNANVKEVKAYAFENTTALETLELTGDEITIYPHAFAGSGLKELVIRCNKLTLYGNTEAANLEKLTIEADETLIYSSAFRHSKLQSLSVWAQQAVIESEAFYGCISLTDVALEGGEFELGAQAFAECIALEEPTLEAVFKLSGEAVFKNAPIRELEMELIGGTIPRFGFLPLETLVLKGTVDGIEQSAFSDLTLLKEVILPEVTSGGIAVSAFSGCAALEKVTFPDRVEGPVMPGAFENCTALEEIVLPNGITELRYSAFMNCTALKRITIPASVTQIDGGFDTEYYGAFVGCVSLRVVEGESADSYAAETLQPYPNLSFGMSGAERYTLTFLSGHSQIYQPPLELAEGQVITLSAPELMEDGLDFQAWYYDEECTQPVEIPFTMPAHDVTVYCACKIAYEYIDWDLMQRSVVQDGDTSYQVIEWYDGEHAAFTVWQQVGAIRKDAIGPNIERISIPATTFNIEPGAFSRAASLKQIWVDPASPYYFVEDGALYTTDGTLLAWPCARQAEVLAIPENVTGIAAHAFNWSNGFCQLEKLYLPDQLQEVGENAFDGIVSSTDVFGPVDGFAAEMAADCGLNYNRYMVIYLSEGEVYGFMQATAGGYLPAIQQPTREGYELYDWGDAEGAAIHADTFLMPEEDVILRALWNETDVDWMILPRGLKTIGADAFRDIPAKAVFCAGGVQTIESGAFAGNTQMEIIKLPSTVTSIADDAFEGCTALEIHGYTDSEAQSYAAEHSIPFVALD